MSTSLNQGKTWKKNIKRYKSFIQKSYICIALLICNNYFRVIDRQTIDRIMDAANIVDVISEFVTLRKRGTKAFTNVLPVVNLATPSTSS